MPVYKDEKRGTWIVSLKYRTWDGMRKSKYKRGFATRREAVQWEHEFKALKDGSIDITFGQCVNRYIADIGPRVKESTMVTKRNIIDTKILPYFKHKKIRELTTADIMHWQNELLGETNQVTGRRYSSSYLKTVHNQMSAILNHAIRFYGLKDNVARKVGNMGSEKEIRMRFWTKEQYLRFRELMMDDPVLYYCFEVLYWCGIREGELLALTPKDIDLEKRTLKVSKTYQVIKGKALITTPKTAKSNRVVVIPEFLCDELQDYLSQTYDIGDHDRLFPVGKSVLNRGIKRGAKELGLPEIRVHDLRHSHVSLLINMGFSAVAIADRLGHESIDITYRYAHLFPSVQNDMAAKLDGLRKEVTDV